MAADVQEVQATESKQPKALKGYQTNCDEKDAKGKPCWGPLKVWHTAPDELRQQFSGEAIYRCQQCWQVYHGLSHEHVHQDVRQAKAS